MKFVSICGPYGDALGYDKIEENIQSARKFTVAIAKMGAGFFCPHLNSAHFEVDCPEIPVDFWYEQDIRFLSSCDAVFLLPGWEKSKGTLGEIEAWKEMVDGPIFTDLNKLQIWLGVVDA